MRAAVHFSSAARSFARTLRRRALAAYAGAVSTPWVEHRGGYRYPGFMFSENGALAREGEFEYRELPFPASARKRFHLWLGCVLLMIVPGMPLLAHWGLLDRLLWLVVVVFGLAYWLYQRIHDCPGCGGRSRALKVPHMGAPVLYLCARCRTFFEHGEIDGGWPWK